MKKPNLFTLFGLIFAVLAALYTHDLHKVYGSGIPKTTAEWIAEAFVGQLWIAAAAFIAVGRQIGERRE